jgi:hypothetical protein
MIAALAICLVEIAARFLHHAWISDLLGHPLLPVAVSMHFSGWARGYRAAGTSSEVPTNG